MSHKFEVVLEIETDNETTDAVGISRVVSNALLSPLGNNGIKVNTLTVTTSPED